MKVIKNEYYIHYVYRITNLLNNKYYIGVHSILKSSKQSPINDGYYGSGILIKKDIKLLGKENFKKEIIKTFSTREEASLEEEKLVTMKEVRDPNCYNLMVGGINTKGNFNYIYVYLKDCLSKIIKITKEEYYKNKDLYVLPVHKQQFIDGYKSKMKDYVPPNKKHHKKEKENKDNNKTRVRYFINKVTLEKIKIVGIKDPDNLYIDIFPFYFYDKINNKFITEQYLLELYNKYNNIERLSSFLKTSTKSLRKIKKYYLENGTLLKPADFNSPTSKKTFSGKTFVNKDKKYIVIDKSEINKYISLGYEPGKLSSNLNVEDIIEFYVKGNSLKDTAKHFNTVVFNIKYKLGLIDNPEATQIWFHKDSEKKTIHLLVTNKLKELIESNGWVEGRKLYE